MIAKLRDIKSIVEISDYSLYYLIALAILVLLIIVMIVFLLTRPKKRKKPTSKDIALKNLKNIDYRNSKNIAYCVVLNISLFTNDRNKNEIEKLLEKLEVYKYKKRIPDMEETLKNDIKKIINGLK